MFNYGLNNMNMMSMGTMGFGNMGMFNLGGMNMFGSSSIFTNCDGSFNYDAMAGFGVASVLVNIGGSIANQAIQEKRATSEKTLKANVKDFDKQIEQVENEKSGYVEEKASLTTTVNDAKAELKNLNQNAGNLYSAVVSKQGILTEAEKNLKADPENETLQGKVKQAQIALAEAEAAQKENKKKIDEQEKIINENTAKIEALDEKIKACNDKIDELKAARNEVQKDLNEQILDQADGNRLSRTSLEDFNNKDFSKENTTATKQDMRRAIAQYRTANNDQKLAIGEKIMQIYDKLPTEDRSNDIRQAYTIIKAEYDELKKNADQTN